MGPSISNVLYIFVGRTSGPKAYEILKPLGISGNANLLFGNPRDLRSGLLSMAPRKWRCSIQLCELMPCCLSSGLQVAPGLTTAAEYMAAFATNKNMVQAC